MHYTEYFTLRDCSGSGHIYSMLILNILDSTLYARGFSWKPSLFADIMNT